jgi:uncharacterized membrane-anchored protein
VLPAIARRLGLSSVAAFWLAYILTRPLGASIADWLGKPHNIGGGVGFGDGTVSAVATVAIAALVGYVTYSRSDIQPELTDQAEYATAEG